MAYFFFQAEDGIRDLTVTGVQTCALPIFSSVARNERNEWSCGLAGRTPATCSGFPQRQWPLRGASREYRRESGKRAGKKRISVRTRPQGVPPAFCTAGKPGCREIGRASCRERV